MGHMTKRVIIFEFLHFHTTKQKWRLQMYVFKKLSFHRTKTEGQRVEKLFLFQMCLDKSR